MLRRARKLISAPVLLAVVVGVSAYGPVVASASAEEQLTHSEARAHIEGFLDAAFFKEPEARAKYVLDQPGSLGLRTCHRVDPFKIKCVGLVRSTGASGERQVCTVAELTAHRGERGQIGVWGYGRVTCQVRFD
jgi:hypothetical protein